uniref:Uncharacterized protein n=1 Tax=Bos indicus x Bos taurus TaxID=30522 RepID=A0A4W2DL30_BOBOX
MSAKYLSCTETHRPNRSWGTSHHSTHTHRGTTLGLGHPHMLGFNAGLLGPYVAVVLVTLVVPLTLFHPPLTLSHNEPCKIRVQLIFLVDASLLNAVPALFLCDAQSTGDVIPKVEPLLLGQVPTSLQVGNSLIIAFHLQLALPQEEVCLHRLPVQLQGAPTVSQGLLVLLHLQVAQCPVGVIHCHQGRGRTHDGAAVAGRRLRVLAAHEEPVALLLELLCARALLGAGAAGAQPCAALLLLLALHGAARHPRPAPAARARDPLGPGPALRHRNFRSAGRRGQRSGPPRGWAGPRVGHGSVRPPWRGPGYRLGLVGKAEPPPGRVAGGTWPVSVLIHEMVRWPDT